MRLVFRPDGSLQEFYSVTPNVPGPVGMTTIDAEYPDYFVSGVSRAVQAGRVTYVAEKVCLDGTPYTPPTLRTPVSYTDALASIQAATTPAQLKNVLYRVCDEFLGLGALEL